MNFVFLKLLGKIENNKEVYGLVNGISFRSKEVLRNDKEKII